VVRAVLADDLDATLRWDGYVPGDNEEYTPWENIVGTMRAMKESVDRLGIAAGGFIPGKVPAVLTPGEQVLPPDYDTGYPGGQTVHVNIPNEIQWHYDKTDPEGPMPTWKSPNKVITITTCKSCGREAIQHGYCASHSHLALSRPRR
jgi:hypothetical protein